jgi:hypothetical protein
MCEVRSQSPFNIRASALPDQVHKAEIITTGMIISLKIRYSNSFKTFLSDLIFV